MKKRLYSILLLFIPLLLAAQESPLVSHYLFNPLTINPSYAGNGSGLRASTYHFKQWTGVKGSPLINLLSVDAPFKNEKIGLGITFYTDKIAVTRENEAIIDYAYRIDIGESVLALGLGASVNFLKTNWSDLIAIDPGDDIYLTDSKTLIAPNIRFGISYYISNFYVGFSIPQFLTTKYDFNKSKQVTSNKKFSGYSYLLNTGYEFELPKSFSLTPSTLLSFSSQYGVDFQFNIEGQYRDFISLTAYYSSNNFVGALARFSITDRFDVGYAYELTVGKLGKYSNGSHAITLRYVFRNRVNAYNPLDF